MHSNGFVVNRSLTAQRDSKEIKQPIGFHHRLFCFHCVISSLQFLLRDSSDSASKAIPKLAQFRRAQRIAPPSRGFLRHYRQGQDQH